jgi:hypothetical protein
MSDLLISAIIGTPPIYAMNKIIAYFTEKIKKIQVTARRAGSSTTVTLANSQQPPLSLN